MSFPNHCIKGIPTVNSFPLSYVLGGQHVMMKRRTDGDAAGFASLCKLTMSQLLKKMVTYS